MLIKNFKRKFIFKFYVGSAYGGEAFWTREFGYNKN